jgi:hypothetical protein
VQFEAQALHPIADDAGMVLGCSAPASEADYFVHGTASRYAGLCLFNPGRHDYLVIDSALHLHALCERYPALRAVIEKLHPDRLRRSIGPRTSAGERWTPLVLPSGLPNVANGLVFESLPRHAADAVDGDPEADEAPGTMRTSVRRVAFEATTLKAGTAMLAPPDLQTLEAVREGAIRSRWSVEPAPGLPLRFMAYERSRAEQQGGPYRGAGTHTELGVAVSDARGQYLFRHHRPPCDAPVAAGTPPQRPDLIVQVPGRSAAPLFQTAPYNNITNLVRIDLLLPAAATAAASVDERAVPRLERRHAHAAIGLGIGIRGRRATDPANSPNPAGGHPGSSTSRPRYG